LRRGGPEDAQGAKGMSSISDADIQSTVKQFILDEFLPGEDPEELQPDTRLISDGILDSIAALKLVDFVEETYRIELEAHEADVDHLDTLNLIVQLVRSKL
jgi:acyl carrier protein